MPIKLKREIELTFFRKVGRKDSSQRVQGMFLPFRPSVALFSPDGQMTTLAGNTDPLFSFAEGKEREWLSHNHSDQGSCLILLSWWKRDGRSNTGSGRRVNHRRRQYRNWDVFLSLDDAVRKQQPSGRKEESIVEQTARGGTLNEEPGSPSRRRCIRFMTRTVCGQLQESRSCLSLSFQIFPHPSSSKWN